MIDLSLSLSDCRYAKDAYEDIWAAIKEAIQLDIRRAHHRHKFDSGNGGSGGGSYGFCMDVLNVVFEMQSADSAEVVQVEDWSGRQRGLR